MAKFQKKEIIVEAEQFIGKPVLGMCMDDDCHKAYGGWGKSPQHVHTLEGPLHVSLGDWIIKGVKGEFYPCKPDVFAATYDAIDGAMSFGQAIEALKMGKRVQRAGWNGKGMWLEFVPADRWNTSVGPSASSVPNAHRLAWIGMKTADDGFVPWLASQTDVLASDWRLVWDFEARSPFGRE